MYIVHYTIMTTYTCRERRDRCFASMFKQWTKKRREHHSSFAAASRLRDRTPEGTINCLKFSRIKSCVRADW